MRFFDSNLKNKRDYGKSIAWPKPKKFLIKADAYLKKIYERWRAYMILKPYPENVRAEMYLIALAHDILKTRHIPTNFVQKWKGDYLNDVSMHSLL